MPKDNPIKAMIIDDEPFVRDDLKFMLSAHQDVEVLWEAGRVDEARALLAKNRPDVVFLDIQLRGGSGMDLIPDIDPKTDVIFVSAHEESLQQVSDIDAVDCIFKPVSMERLAQSLKKLHR